MSLGMRIRTLRKSRGLTQQELADKAEASRIYVQALESNRRMPSMKLLKRLASALEVEPMELLESLPAGRTRKLHLEEVFSNSEDIEVWYRSRRLEERDLKLVQRLVEAALAQWEEDIHNEDGSEGSNGD